MLAGGELMCVTTLLGADLVCVELGMNHRWTGQPWPGCGLPADPHTGCVASGGT